MTSIRPVVNIRRLRPRSEGMLLAVLMSWLSPFVGRSRVGQKPLGFRQGGIGERDHQLGGREGVVCQRLAHPSHLGGQGQQGRSEGSFVIGLDRVHQGGVQTVESRPMLLGNVVLGLSENPDDHEAGCSGDAGAGVAAGAGEAAAAEGSSPTGALAPISAFRAASSVSTASVEDNLYN